MGMKTNPSSTTTSTSSTSSQYSNPSFEGGSISSVSHVLMTSGRALLDNSLFTFPDPSESKHQIISTSSNPLTPIPMPLMSTTTTTTPSQQLPSETTEKALSTWNAKYSDFNPHPSGSNNDHTSGDGSTIRPIIKIDSTLSPTSPPVLVMLLPASSIRWGSTWQNSSDHPFHSYTKDSSSSSYASPRMNGDHEGGREGQGDGYDHSSLWVEIKCSVYSAELVRNVTLY